MPNNSKIQYRKLTADEKLHIARQQSITWPDTAGHSTNVDELRENITKCKDEYDFMEVYGAVDCKGHVLGGMDVEPFTMWFDGHRVPMAGIGGVVSLPEHRRGGNIRNVFAKVFEDIYENGTVFSHLFPFSYDYYRKFGYEHCGSAVSYTLLLADARRLQAAKGTAHEFIKDDGDASAVQKTLIDVYEQFASRHNLMISRPEYRVKNLFDVPPFGLDRLYYWKDAGGTIKAWVKYKKDGKTLAVRDIVWADHESMLGILQFLGMYDGAAIDMTFRSSPELTAELYWSDPFNVKAENQWLGMSRVVNAARALELMAKPAEDGEFTIALTDNFAPWNTGTFTVKYGSGECTVQKSGSKNKASKPPDIETNERTFLQMVLGTYDLRTLTARGTAKINSDIRKLEKVFHRKPLLITDYF